MNALDVIATVYPWLFLGFCLGFIASGLILRRELVALTWFGAGLGIGMAAGFFMRTAARGEVPNRHTAGGICTATAAPAAPETATTAPTGRVH